MSKTAVEELRLAISCRASREEIAQLYARVIEVGVDVDWRAINLAIVERGFSLDRLKKRAWNIRQAGGAT